MRKTPTGQTEDITYAKEDTYIAENFAGGTLLFVEDTSYWREDKSHFYGGTEIGRDDAKFAVKTTAVCVKEVSKFER